MANIAATPVESRAPNDDTCHDAAKKFAPPQWIYRNLTPYRIHASYGQDCSLVTPCRNGRKPNKGEIAKVLSIPALGEAVVPREDADQIQTLAMRQLGQLELRPAPSCFFMNLPRAIVIYGWLAIALVVVFWALLFGGVDGVPWQWCVALAVFVPVAALVVATCREIYIYHRFRRYCKESKISLEGVQHGSQIQSFVDGAPRVLAEKLAFAGVLIVTVVGLGVAIHLTTQLNDLMPIDYRAAIQLNNPLTGVDDTTRDSTAFWQLFVGHVTQWVLVSIAAITPAAMYFQFDRQRLAAVQRQWIRDMFRLDPTVRTVRDIEAKYGSQIDASFGIIDPDSGMRLGRGRRSPIIVVTILNVIGWFLVISTTQIPQLRLNSLPGRGSEWRWPDGPSFPVSAFFSPQLTLVGYAFLGAYVFGMLYTIRGYQRRDLQPRTYNTIVARILVAYALALVVSVVYDGAFAEVVMFFVGFTPQSALVWLREKVSSESLPVIPLHEPAPLTDLEGIDLYDRTRLGEAGVNNVVALAHADIIDLMSSTRIPAAELVDWTDQAILYLKVGRAAVNQLETSDRPHKGDVAPDVRLNFCHLRCLGIRTATDLMQVYCKAKAGHGDEARATTELNWIRAALTVQSGAKHSRDSIGSSLQTIIDTLGNEEWFAQVHNWRNSEYRTPDAWYHYLDGHDWTIQRMLPSDASPAVETTQSGPSSERFATSAAPPLHPDSGAEGVRLALGG